MHRRLLLATLLLVPALAAAQVLGAWRPLSNTARAITGDLDLTDTKIILNFSAFTLAQIRTLTPGEVAALFPATKPASGSGDLFRTSIPAGRRFLHKNTLCGADDTQWIATFVSGKTLQVAMFSGNAMPTLTPEAINNTPTLCGTYSYIR